MLILLIASSACEGLSWCTKLSLTRKSSGRRAAAKRASGGPLHQRATKQGLCHPTKNMGADHKIKTILRNSDNQQGEQLAWAGVWSLSVPDRQPDHVIRRSLTDGQTMSFVIVHQRTSTGHSAGLDGPVPDAWSGVRAVDQQSVCVALAGNLHCCFIDCRLSCICWTRVSGFSARESSSLHVFFLLDFTRQFEG
jgi:hypothetical protein